MGATPRDPATRGRNTFGQKGVVAFVQSFETGEQGAVKIFFPFKVRIDKIRAIVTKAIAGTDAGTVTGANSTGNSAGGVLTAAISDPLATEYTATPTTNNVVPANDYYKLTPAKTTAGGKLSGTLEYTVIS